MSRDLELEDGVGMINHVEEHNHLGVMVTNYGNHEAEINNRINKGQAAISKLNYVLWSQNVTPKIKTQIYRASIKSTITYAADSWQLKTKSITKLNSTEMDFWRGLARILRRDNIKNTIVNQKINVTRSLLDDIKMIHSGEWDVQEMDEAKIIKKIVKWQPKVKKEG